MKNVLPFPGRQVEPRRSVRVEHPLDSLIRTLGGIAERELDLPPAMLREVVELLVLVRAELPGWKEVV